jgi:hypothetical protein
MPSYTKTLLSYETPGPQGPQGQEQGPPGPDKELQTRIVESDVTIIPADPG